MQLSRVVVAACAVSYTLLVLKRKGDGASETDTETQSLLGSASVTSSCRSPPAYDAIPESEQDAAKLSDDDDDAIGEDDEEEDRIKLLQKERLQKVGWLGYLKGFLIFAPHILPYKDRRAQLWLMALVMCMAAERLTTLFIPLQLANIIDALTMNYHTGNVPVKELAIYIALVFPVSVTISVLESLARTRVSQFSEYQLNSLAFSHVMSLSMDYHTSRSTGKVITAIEQGTSLTYLLDTFLSLGPRVIDLILAAFILTKKFDASVGIVMAFATITNTYITIKGNTFAADLERRFINNNQEQNKVLYDSISNWYTVAIHNRSKYEHRRYNGAVLKSLLSTRRYTDTLELVYSTQEVFLQLGFMTVLYMGAARVADGSSTISTFVFLTSYWDMISRPMVSIAHQFQDTASRLVKAEWLYQLLQTKPSVQDKEDAQPLNITNCEIEFKNVSFAYSPERQILHDVSFKAQPGQSIALVGETGSGKSTILKLLFRFYDVTGGSITIDGQDLREVTLDSLRDSLGAVPQDPSVFDQTIMENLLYARPYATEQEVYEACRRARIHDQIMSFPDGYRARIGERGVKLSGGELQRLAIARVIIRRPRIVVLDEATSAVDSETEASVQQAIKALSEGRTVFTIAHRLSTVVAADRILVVHKGEIVEGGTHRELLALDGRYAKLWRIQTAGHNEEDLLIGE